MTIEEKRAKDRVRGKKYRDKDPEIKRALARVRKTRFNLLHKDERREEARVKYHEDVEKSREKDRLEYERNKDRRRLSKRLWLHTNRTVIYERLHRLYREDIEESRRVGRERKRQRFITKATIEAVLDDNIKIFGVLTCYLCCKEIDDSWHLEHKMPLSRGGTNEVVNLGVAHDLCNLYKGRLTVDEYYKTLR